jgi:hypothetical protein
MEPRARSVFLLLVAVQAAHSIEEYAFALYEVLPPARLVSSLLSSDLAVGFAILNASLVAFGLWCYLVPMRRSWPSARAWAWLWVGIELGNGVGHPLLALRNGGYFPGLATSPLLLVLASYLAARLVRSRNAG